MNPIRAYREARGISIRDLAAELKCSRTLIGRVELGEAILPPDRAHYWGKLMGADLSSLVSKGRPGKNKTPWRAKGSSLA